MTSFMDLCKARFAVRQFSDKPLEKEKLNLILEAGNAAPTAKNFQPQRIYILESKEALAKMDSLTPCRYGAPIVLMLTYNTDEEWKNELQDGIHSGVEDVSIVATHMMLEAYDIGVDSIWINRFANAKAEEIFGLPANEKVVLFLPLGYRADGAKPFPQHTHKKDLKDIVKTL